MTPVSAPAGRDVHVTRHFSLTGETKQAKNQSLGRTFPPLPEPSSPTHKTAQAEADHTQLGTFCDWVSMYQTHESGLPILQDGCFIRLDADGGHESTTLKKVRVEGSHESSIFIRSDGQTVHFEGNVSKFGRQDNVFGYTFDQCLLRINAILQAHQLPPFTPGKRTEVHSSSGWRPHWTGARITRLDLTQNFATGGKENAAHFMRFLAMQQASRLKTGTHGEGETVDFGRGSRRVYSKAYLKGPELLKHARKDKRGSIPELSKPFDPYLFDLSEWCNSIGLVRFETTYKATYLIDNFQNFLGSLDMKQLEIDFKERQSVFTRATCDIDELTDLQPKLLSVYRMWQAGDDVSSKFSRAQFYRHRAALLPYGVDIAVRSNVIKFEPKTRIIKLESAVMPHFYQFPPPSMIRLAA